MYRVVDVALSRIVVKDQTMRYEPEDDSIIELANELAAHGLHECIVVSVLADGDYQLLDGGRRLAAARRLGWLKIPAHLYELGDQPVKAVALRSNVHAKPMTLQEECEAVGYLHYEEKKSPDQISAALSKSRSWVMRRLALPNLPEELRGPVFDGRLAIQSAEYIARVEDAGARAYLATQATQCGWSASDVRLSVETYLATPSLEAAVVAGQAAGEAAPAVQRVGKECAACGQWDELKNLVSVWIHGGGGCIVETQEVGGVKNERRSEPAKD